MTAVVVVWSWRPPEYGWQCLCVFCQGFTSLYLSNTDSSLFQLSVSSGSVCRQIFRKTTRCQSISLWNGIETRVSCVQIFDHFGVALCNLSAWNDKNVPFWFFEVRVYLWPAGERAEMTEANISKGENEFGESKKSLYLFRVDFRVLRRFCEQTHWQTVITHSIECI